jgi:hypothetical protein
LGLVTHTAPTFLHCCVKAKWKESNSNDGAKVRRLHQLAEIMGAICTAMSRLPTDLRAAAQKNPIILQFLQDVWGALSIEDGKSNSSSTNMSSGLDSICSIFQDMLSQWDDKGMGDFASSVLQQLDNNGSAQQDHAFYPQLIKVVKEELESAMKPELLNRIDKIVMFLPLSSWADLADIASLNIEKIIT